MASLLVIIFAIELAVVVINNVGAATINNLVSKLSQLEYELGWRRPTDAS